MPGGEHAGECQAAAGTVSEKDDLSGGIKDWGVMGNRGLYVEESIVGAVRGMLAGRVNELLGGGSLYDSAG
jgi:hypothetical protein